MAFIRAFPVALRRLTISSQKAINTSTKVTSNFSSPNPKPTSLFSRRAFLISTAAVSLSIPVVAMAQSDVSITEVTVGNGDSFKSGDLLKLHYTLTINGFQEAGGKVVDSSRSRGRPFNYNYDTGAVIKGWDMGVKDMKVGGKRRLVIPPELGYGSRGAGAVIPANTTLYFDIELLGVGYK